MGNDEHVIDKEYEINRPHYTGKLYQYFIAYKFYNAVKCLPIILENKTVLDICCGSGMISEYYAKEGANVTGIDISKEAIERANIRKKRYDFAANFIASDAEKLPYADNSFDIVSVHDGLHHIKEPLNVIREMIRIAKTGVVIIEPAKSLLTKVSVSLGISTDYEGDDYVYRFTEKEFKKLYSEMGCNKLFIKKYIMYYPHEPGVVFKILSLPVFYQLTKITFKIFYLIFGRYGNKMQIVITK